MDRTLAEFPDGKAAVAAVNELVAGSFNAEDIEFFAVRADGSSVPVPIRYQSEVGRGFVLGGILSLPVGIGFAMSLGLQASPSLAILVGGLGCALGATLGVGWWSVRADRSSIPRDATRFVLAVKGPAGRTAHAQSVMQQAGGTDATPRATPPASGPSAQ
ncbi:MAG: hypothetical protein AAGA48_07310 [Myxococcota bacterium]